MVNLQAKINLIWSDFVVELLKQKLIVCGSLEDQFLWLTVFDCYN